MAAEKNKTTNRQKSGRLDPRAEEMLKQMEQMDNPPLEQLTPAQARGIINAAAKKLPVVPETVANVKNFNIPGPAGQIPIRTYTPQGSGPFPLLVYFHGGGWVFCNLDTHDNVCRSLANGAGCVVVSVDYRLAPEHKFPAAVEDAYAATKWVESNTMLINGDSTRIAVGGDSSGGNLAAVVSLMARDMGSPTLIFQLLAYPAIDISSFNTDSHRDYAEGYGLTGADMKWFQKHYLERKEDQRNPHASPLLADDLSGLPPALLITAEFDVLGDEGKAYANRLKQAGVSVKYIQYKGMIHAGVAWAVALDMVKDALDEATSTLRSAFSK